MVPQKRVIEESSFRDPSGFVFLADGKIYRQINKSYLSDYGRLMNSGLYKQLVDDSLLIAHKQIATNVLRPELIPFVSYPYEWSFGQLKAAALLTLRIQQISLDKEMSLKDGSAFNVQFIGSRPVFIDTLSFEKYLPGKPWVAYRQFCQHFLAPLALASTKDMFFIQLLKNYLQGIPLDIASGLLPSRTRLNPGLLFHIHLNAGSSKLIKTPGDEKKISLSKKNLQNLVENLKKTVERLQPKRRKTTWSDYYQETNYSKAALNHKKRLVARYLKEIGAKTVLDLGANTGEFSRVAADLGAYTISADYDPATIEDNYQKTFSSQKILPLVIDLLNPTPSLGWANSERKSFWERVKVDAILALALIHHLAIANNLPFEKIAKLFSDKSKYLIVEFIPKSDSQLRRLLATREDIFSDYSQEYFEKTFSDYFKILKSDRIGDSERSLYLMINRK